jgi:hypothetical protein
MKTDCNKAAFDFIEKIAALYLVFMGFAGDTRYESGQKKISGKVLDIHRTDCS